jgi:8-oxo-dGTP pyrophosphatase MutT (NUDIX family)
MIGIKIVKNDTSTVAKAVIIDSKERVLFLKRSNYLKKFAGDWDLPGGHIKQDEDLLSGLEREVLEESGLEIEDPVYLKKIENLNFFYCAYNSGEIKLSHEHTDYKFFEKGELDSSEKFQKVALDALEERRRLQ